MERGSLKLAVLVVLAVIATSGAQIRAQIEDRNVWMPPCHTAKDCVYGEEQCVCSSNNVCTCRVPPEQNGVVSSIKSQPQFPAAEQNGKWPCKAAIECGERPLDCQCTEGFCQCGNQ